MSLNILILQLSNKMEKFYIAFIFISHDLKYILNSYLLRAL